MYLQMINACRLYLKVLWVRDLLCEGTSTRLDGDIIQGTKIKNSSTLTYPVQRQPSAKAFTLWKEFIF
jgi:hypothetical protein